MAYALDLEAGLTPTSSEEIRQLEANASVKQQKQDEVGVQAEKCEEPEWGFERKHQA